MGLMAVRTSLRGGFYFFAMVTIRAVVSIFFVFFVIKDNFGKFSMMASDTVCFIWKGIHVTGNEFFIKFIRVTGATM